MLVVLAEALGLRPHQIHAAADNLTERREGQAMLMAQEPLGKPEPQMRVVAMMASPQNRPIRHDRRRELIALLDLLSEQDLELVLDMVRRLRG